MYDIGEDSGRAFIAMEFLDGKTLKEVMQQGPLETQAAGEHRDPGLDGLEAGHAEMIDHRGTVRNFVTGALAHPAIGTRRREKRQHGSGADGISEFPGSGERCRS